MRFAPGVTTRAAAAASLKLKELAAQVRALEKSDRDATKI
jgi:hypothetical protein